MEHSDIRLRGHTLLCLQGYRGEGYSPSFTENLSRIHRNLCGNPEQAVEVRDGPDDVCKACPHLSEAGCSVDGAGSEEAMRAQDRIVLAKLALATGDRIPWTEVLNRIAGTVTSASLPGICGSCRWLPLGYCQEGLDALHGCRARAVPLASIPQAPTDDFTAS